MGSRVRGKYVKAFSKNEFKFREARIVFGNKGAGVGNVDRTCFVAGLVV